LLSSGFQGTFNIQDSKFYSHETPLPLDLFSQVEQKNIVLCALSLLAIITGGFACNLNTSKLGSRAEQILLLQVTRE